MKKILTARDVIDGISLDVLFEGFIDRAAWEQWAESLILEYGNQRVNRSWGLALNARHDENPPPPIEERPPPPPAPPPPHGPKPVDVREAEVPPRAPQPPEPQPARKLPPNTVLRKGGGFIMYTMSFCPVCASDEHRGFFGLGYVCGCIHPDCVRYWKREALKGN